MRVLPRLILIFLLVLSTACTDQDDGQYIPGVNGPFVNIQDGKVLLSIELENIELQAGLTLPVPKLKNSSITLGPAMNDQGQLGGTLIRVAFDPRDLESEDFRVVPAQTLPDGRPFPFMIDGTLPALALHVPKAKNTTFYLSEQLFGFFLPVKIPQDFNVDVHYRIKINGKNYGIVSLIHPNEWDESSGVVVVLTLDEIRNNPEAMQLLKLSRQYKNAIF